MITKVIGKTKAFKNDIPLTFHYRSTNMDMECMLITKQPKYAYACTHGHKQPLRGLSVI